MRKYYIKLSAVYVGYNISSLGTTIFPVFQSVLSVANSPSIGPPSGTFRRLCKTPTSVVSRPSSATASSNYTHLRHQRGTVAATVTQRRWPYNGRTPITRPHRSAGTHYGISRIVFLTVVSGAAREAFTPWQLVSDSFMYARQRLISLNYFFFLLT